MTLSIDAARRLSQGKIYDRLQKTGSQWLKCHVLYASNRLVVLNKPEGLVCQLNYSKKAERDVTFLNPVFQDIRKWLVPRAEPRHVHRLDKLTTGCFLVPLSIASATSLSNQFQNDEVKKVYLALVRGGEKSFPSTDGEICDPILYEDGRAELHSTGKLATTRWKLIGSSPKAPVSLLRLDLLTGNKHQLRIHLAKSLKVPILGDSLYSRKPINSSITSLTTIPDGRLFLHSAEISFLQDRNNERQHLTIGAPVPNDFSKICDDLDIPLPPSNKKASLSIDDQIQDENSTLRLWDPSGKYT
ncbi:pseudouridine synthase [Pholiota conissans]|uniref:21S rRNA pseudouridine(2819) synthase n=1 Tax=Pholiota conissans TaxID=109636 RepID=A0A9P6CRD6_9AGAR|nr:pseudouridine synthase [Pholiota conissans]